MDRIRGVSSFCIVLKSRVEILEKVELIRGTLGFLEWVYVFLLTRLTSLEMSLAL